MESKQYDIVIDYAKQAKTMNSNNFYKTNNKY